MAHTQRYIVDGHMRTRTFHPERPQDNPFRHLEQKSQPPPQPQRNTEAEAHQVDGSSDSVRKLTTRKELCAVKEKSIKRDKTQAPKERSANPGLFKILLLGGRWAFKEDIKPGTGNRTSYATPKFGWRPFGGTR